MWAILEEEIALLPEDKLVPAIGYQSCRSQLIIIGEAEIQFGILHCQRQTFIGARCCGTLTQYRKHSIVTEQIEEDEQFDGEGAIVDRDVGRHSILVDAVEENTLTRSSIVRIIQGLIDSNGIASVLCVGDIGIE